MESRKEKIFYYLWSVDIKKEGPMLSHYVDAIKKIALPIVVGITAILVQYDYAFYALIGGFTFNFILGMGADAKTKKKLSFDMAKATEGFLILGVYMMTIFAVYAMTYRIPEVSETIVSYLTWVVSYFYFTNGFKNATIIFPNDKGIQFIYLVLSTEVFYRLRTFVGIQTEKIKSPFKKNDESGNSDTG